MRLQTSVVVAAVVLVCGLPIVSRGLQTIHESDVIGLVGDLDIRPIMGPGYGASRSAIVNDLGQIETAMGGLGDCMHVDGFSGPCDPHFVDEEVPGGSVDGSNGTFTVVNPPYPASSLHLFRNGLLQKVGFDYSLSGSTITFVSAATPQPGDTLLASYRY